MRKLLIKALGGTLPADPTETDPPQPEEAISVYAAEQIAQLRNIFKPVVYTPRETQLEDVAFNAGQQCIIDHIERTLKKQRTKMLSVGLG